MNRAIAALVAGLAAAGTAGAQTQQVPNVLFKGVIRTTDAAGGYDEDTRITCRGMPRARR